MSAFAIANLAVASVNALAAAVAAVGIWYGIRAMVRASDERGQQQRAATQQQSEAEERRHEESMTALKALIAGRRTTGRERRAPDALPRRRDLEVERLSRSRGAQVPAPSVAAKIERRRIPFPVPGRNFFVPRVANAYPGRS